MKDCFTEVHVIMAFPAVIFFIKSYLPYTVNTAKAVNFRHPMKIVNLHRYINNNFFNECFQEFSFIS